MKFKTAIVIINNNLYAFISIFIKEITKRRKEPLIFLLVFQLMPEHKVPHLNDEMQITRVTRKCYVYEQMKKRGKKIKEPPR